MGDNRFLVLIVLCSDYSRCTKHDQTDDEWYGADSSFAENPSWLNSGSSIRMPKVLRVESDVRVSIA